MPYTPFICHASAAAIAIPLVAGSLGMRDVAAP